MNDEQSKTGINKQWAESELTKKPKKQPINIPKIPEDARLPQAEDLEKLEVAPGGDIKKMDLAWSFNQPSETALVIPADDRNKAQLFWEGKLVGTISIRDGKTFHFEGQMDESAAAFLILIKRFIDNWLQSKDK